MAILADSSNLQIKGLHANIINGAVDLKLTQSGSIIHIEYGDYSLNTSGGAMQKRSTVSADVIVSLENERIGDLNAITVDVVAKYTNFKRVENSADGVKIGTTIHIYNSQERTNEVFNHRTAQIQSSETYSDVSLRYSITIPAQGTAYAGLGRYWNDIDTSDKDDEFSGGFEIFNTLLPDYRPMARIVNGREMSCNRSGGFLARMVNGQEVELRTLNGGVGTGNPPSIVRNNTEVNQRKIGNES